MAVYLHAIETWTPDTVYSQAEAAELLQTQHPDPKTRRRLSQLYRRTAIDQRSSVAGAFGTPDAPLFRDIGEGRWADPATGDRNRVFAQVSSDVAPSLARKTLDAAPDVHPADITHVITASCTGAYSPGPDIQIVRALNLSPRVERFHLGFMGCYAAFPALRMAESICRANPDATVLIQSIELCSLHLHPHATDPDTLVSGALFADGAGCALVTSRTPKSPGYRIQQLASTLTPTGEDSMAWNIGNHGFNITLSAYVPRILGGHIRDALLPFLHSTHHTPADISFWAVHPGGKAILDRVSKALSLQENALDLPRKILRNHGNMSSATLYFLLREGLSLPPSGPCAAMAFGPGLTVEMALLHPHQPAPSHA